MPRSRRTSQRKTTPKKVEEELPTDLASLKELYAKTSKTWRTISDLKDPNLKDYVASLKAKLSKMDKILDKLIPPLHVRIRNFFKSASRGDLLGAITEFYTMTLEGMSHGDLREDWLNMSMEGCVGHNKSTDKELKAFIKENFDDNLLDSIIGD